jgi:hypothetical protein
MIIVKDMNKENVKIEFTIVILGVMYNNGIIMTNMIDIRIISSKIFFLKFLK